MAKEVGSRLGEVEEVEWKKKKDDLSMFMRVRVALSILKPIRRGGYIADSDGEKSWVSFKYERLPIFCHYCGILGHDLKHCVAHYAVEKKRRSNRISVWRFSKGSGRSSKSFN